MAESSIRGAGRSTHPAYLPYLYSVICLGLAAIGFAMIRIMQSHLGYEWIVLACLTALSSFCTIKIPGTNSKITIGDTFFFTNVILYGISAGVLTAALDALLSSLRSLHRSQRLQYSLFNVSAMACSAHLSGLAFYAVIGRGPLWQPPRPDAMDMMLPLAVLAFTHYLWNSGTVAIIVALEKHKDIVTIWRDSFLWTSITYFAGAAAAGFIALSIGTVTLQVVGVVVPVLMAIYFTYKTYLDKVREVSSLAYYDTLTKLPNRVLFKEHLIEALTVASRCKQMVALMFLDIDNFKRINDTYGHGLGDALLKSVAGRLTSTLRIHDRADLGSARQPDVVAGRFGGDEFTLLLQDVKSPQHVAVVAQRLLQAFVNPFAFEGQEVTASISIGISMYPADGVSAESLLKNADAAMFHAKDCGRCGFQFYSQSMNEISSQKLELENDLRKALVKKEFLLYFQPKVDGRTREITGAEALVRWQHPTQGLLPASLFIPLAEETGLIRPLGEWIFRSVCEQVVAWSTSGFAAVPIAVNLSGIQFRQRGLQELFFGILEQTGVDPRYLELEITESTLMQNEEEASKSLREFQLRGVKISIDDFGTGYSSLSRLTRFSLDALKVDRSFVKDLSTSTDDRAIVKAIIAMAHGLELRVIAEGVETEQQYQFLKMQGCDEIQGYLFGRPMPAEEFSALLGPLEKRHVVSIA